MLEGAFKITLFENYQFENGTSILNAIVNEIKTVGTSEFSITASQSGLIFNLPYDGGLFFRPYHNKADYQLIVIYILDATVYIKPHTT